MITKSNPPIERIINKLMSGFETPSSMKKKKRNKNTSMMIWERFEWNGKTCRSRNVCIEYIEREKFDEKKTLKTT